MNRPCASIASAGSKGELVPLWSVSLPQSFQVPGSNWAKPFAPVSDSACASQVDSFQSCAARISGGSPGQFMAAFSISGRNFAGTLAGSGSGGDVEEQPVSARARQAVAVMSIRDRTLVLCPPG